MSLVQPLFRFPDLLPDLFLLGSRLIRLFLSSGANLLRGVPDLDFMAMGSTSISQTVEGQNPATPQKKSPLTPSFNIEI